jgi:D-aminoacyl-tRNA deacylase
MKFAIIVSEKDVAGMNIKDKLLKNQEFSLVQENFGKYPVFELANCINKTKLYTLEEDTIHAEHIDKKIDADYFIFATKHQAASGTHSLSVHVPGNFGLAGAGGKDGFLCKTMSSFMKYAYRRMVEFNNLEKLDFQVIQECTHHGPCIDKPVMFIEIGSTEESWIREDAGIIISKIIIELVSTHIPKCEEYIVIGGMHYNYVADKVNKMTDFCVGHICTKYNMDKIDDAMISQMIEKSESGREFKFLFDWKGNSSAEKRNEIISMLESKNIKWFRSDKFFKE